MFASCHAFTPSTASSPCPIQYPELTHIDLAECPGRGSAGADTDTGTVRAGNGYGKDKGREGNGKKARRSLIELVCYARKAAVRPPAGPPRFSPGSPALMLAPTDIRTERRIRTLHRIRISAEYGYGYRTAGQCGSGSAHPHARTPTAGLGLYRMRRLALQAHPQARVPRPTARNTMTTTVNRLIARHAARGMPTAVAATHDPRTQWEKAARCMSSRAFSSDARS
ncbi:hypothetical protein EVG20_g4776 [Dentipellis fragilis]|uniref:Uncharacterized protein n=1 Tax=Dentipellis fragilis TaxID=205917 RepID=A0A4Y9YVS2_9AGAM|nr:hypothetical protein EVG20_g4776 [Dentipellis fragilis]